MKLKLVGCNALRRELCALAALSPHEIDLVLLPPGAMRGAALARAVGEPNGAEYMLLGCGLCAAEGLAAEEIPLIVPAAHDCAQLLLGSAARYRRAFSANVDAPRWLLPGGCPSLSARYGAPCAVISPLGPRPALPAGTREYAAELSMLRDLLNGIWDERFIEVAPGFCLRASGDGAIAYAEPTASPGV
ncbi:MAG: DUF1638 domain-containing protein [Oscillospiraceae bacterium]